MVCGLEEENGWREKREGERREGWAAMCDPSFCSKLLSVMGRVEERFAEGDKRMASIEEDLKPLKKMYYAVLGSAAVGTMLLGTLIYIYNSDKSSIAEAVQRQANMQEAIYKQGTAIEKLLQSHQELERDTRRDIERIETNMNRIQPGLRTK